MIRTSWTARFLTCLASAFLLLAATTIAYAIGTPAGTVIQNQATVDYRDVNNNALQSLSNVVNTTVSQVAAIDVSPNNSSNADPGDVIYYAHIVTNNGNGDDTVDITAISSNGWTVTLYRDVNEDSAYTAGTDILLADTDADLVPDTGVLGDNDTFYILAALSVPSNAGNAVSDTTTVTGTSSFNTGISDSAIDTTTIQAPVLDILKSVLPAGNQPPGTVLTYTMVITNNGAAQANQVVLTDPIPNNTTYVAESITFNAATRTDAADVDNADFDDTNPGMVTVNVGTMAPAQVATVTFQVTIN